MIPAGLIAFNAPLVLFALIALPVIYWLLRVLPPSPRRVPFPAVRLLFGLRSEEETPAHTPPWLMALRMLIAGLVILALAQPVVNPVAGGSAERPLLLVLDDDWAAAVDWPLRRDVALDRVAQAARDDRLVALARTSATPNGDPPPVIGPLPAREVLALVEEFEPRPWPADRTALAAPLAALPFATAPEVVWIANGLADAADGNDGPDFAATLQRLGPLTVLLGDRTAPLLVLDDRPGPRLIASVAAAEPLVAGATVTARAGDGRLLAQAPVDLTAGDPLRGTATVDLPADALNRIARLELNGPPTAGGVALVDRRWQHHGIGIVSIGDPGLYPLLSPLHYVERAIQPFSEPITGDVATLTATAAPVDVILATDEGLPGVEARRELDAWIEDGGIYVQFAGPRLAESSDAMVPVALRTGDRLLSGSMSWTEPMSLAPFPPGSPFAGLEVPDDVVVNRQVLAQPGPELVEHTWAQLADGTPLVTAARRGEGWLVLVHVSARPDWSTLPLSGLFVEMLQRITELSDGQEVAGSSLPLAPRASLDAFGRLGDPPPAARPLPAEPTAGIRPGAQHPPGLYGTDGGVTRAFNLGGTIAPPQRLEVPAGADTGTLAGTEETPLMPWLLAAAALLLALDALATLWLKGVLFPRTATRAMAGTALLALMLAGALQPQPAAAQGLDDEESFALAMSTETHLAYVMTGDPEVDSVSEAGLNGLTQVLRLRTAAEPVGAVGVDLETDELAFFPFLYWPMTEGQEPPSPAAVARLETYLQTGGTIVFDTRDGPLGQGGGLGGAGQQALRSVTAGMDVPPLVPVPPDHVLTRAFYLLQDFPGRFDGGDVWVEDTDTSVNDGVASIIVGSNDWAAAWAMDAAGRPVMPVIPGGDLQREMALRFGVNLVMYALTGNYKADQVHLPAIIERLGQ
ncbi:MAG: DUF4159 domain-containing protein [Rhodospirillaceae bacterium]|nr:DUF4159 domain-containing protein [Rhodospirillaceae bacterium]